MGKRFLTTSLSVILVLLIQGGSLLSEAVHAPLVPAHADSDLELEPPPAAFHESQPDRQVYADLRGAANTDISLFPSPCVGDTSQVGSYPSPYGGMDMGGSVWEWVADWYQSDCYASSPDTNPTGLDSGINKVMRGGSRG